MSEKRPRGRPRRFDPEAALAEAAAIFRRQGYAATALDGLADAMALKRSSLYAAFGNKQTLYLRSLDLVAGKMFAGLDAALGAKAPLQAKLLGFFDGAIASYFEEEEGVSCLIMCTAPAEALSDRAIRDRLSAVLTGIDVALEQRLREEEAARAQPLATPPAVLARLISAILQSLALRIRAGMTRDAAREFCREMIAALPI